MTLTFWQGRFDAEVCGPEVVAVAGRLVAATQALWARVAPKMLPTPAKFHYLFNMRDISKARVLFGVCVAGQQEYHLLRHLPACLAMDVVILVAWNPQSNLLLRLSPW